MGGTFNEDFIEDCRLKLQTLKMNLLNRARESQLEFASFDRYGGDEIDMTVAQIAEDHFLVAQDRLRLQLAEIEFALARIQNGSYGICEETLEPIEQERLLAIPFTRLSIEGAEIQWELGLARLRGGYFSPIAREFSALCKQSFVEREKELRAKK